MALLSDQGRATRGIELPRDVSVIDVIEMKAGRGLDHAPGVVAVLDSFPSAKPELYIGRIATIRRADGRITTAEVEATRSHRVTISFFFRGLMPDDVPIGSRITIDES